MNKYLIIFLFFCFFFLTLKANENINTNPKNVAVNSQISSSARIDIFECDFDMIKDENVIAQFVNDLINFMKLKPDGDPIIKRWPERDNEITVSQLTKTGSMSMNFMPGVSAASITINNSDHFDPYSVGAFCQKYFNAHDLIVTPLEKKLLTLSKRKLIPDT